MEKRAMEEEKVKKGKGNIGKEEEEGGKTE